MLHVILSGRTACPGFPVEPVGVDALHAVVSSAAYRKSRSRSGRSKGEIHVVISQSGNTLLGYRPSVWPRGSVRAGTQLYVHRTAGEGGRNGGRGMQSAAR